MLKIWLEPAENDINDSFRRELLTSSLALSIDYDFDKVLDDNNNQDTLSVIENNRKEYIRILKSIGEWNKDIDSQVSLFFTKYKEAYENSQISDENGRRMFTLDYLTMSFEFYRIKNIAAQAQVVEEKKGKIRTPIDTFLKTVNTFFSMSDDKKQISISVEGRIVITADSPKREVSLYNLSSGEKQIIIIFACLIFGLPPESSGIYIIDEPEASLHLTWQNIFVESICKVNSSIQLIFATHSPEIIGRNSNRAVKLKKQINMEKIERTDLPND